MRNDDITDDAVIRAIAEWLGKPLGYQAALSFEAAQ
jgi:hypothetical protein